MPNLPCLKDEVYFGDTESPLPDWRKMPESEPNDDDAPLSPEQHKALVGMLGFDPSKADDVNAHAEAFSESGNSLRGVEIFAAGKHRGKRYTLRDLNEMVANFNRASTGQKPGFRVPLVIGHEETQEYLERSDLPAAGWAYRVWRDGKKLKADFEDVPPKVARLLKGKSYRTVSSEVYDDPPEGVPGCQGKMLRRVALLGGDIPQVKSLDDIPAPESHSEGHQFARRQTISVSSIRVKPSKTAGAFWVFSEVHAMPDVDKFEQSAGQKAMWAKVDNEGSSKTARRKGSYKYKKKFMGGRWAEGGDNPGETMSREEMIDALAEHGFDTDAIKDVPEDALAEMLRVCEDKDDDGGDSDDMDDIAGDGDDKGKDRSDPFAEFADDELPEPKNDDEKKDYAERARKYAGRARKYLEKYCSMGRMGESDDQQPEDNQHAEDDNMNPPAAQPKKTTVTHQFNESRIQAAIDRAVERALNGRVKGKLERFEKFTEEQLTNQRRADLDAFLSSALKDGYVTPAQLDDGNPANLYVVGMAQNASAVIHKFREGKREIGLTQYDLWKRSIRAGKPHKFSEKLGGNKRGEDRDAKEDRKEWAESTFQKFNETFSQCGVSEEDFVSSATNSTADDYAMLRKNWDDRAIV